MQPSPSSFLVAPNPDPDSKLPYLLWLPIDGGLVLKAREPWPATARVYCHRHDGAWPDDVEVVEVPIRSCRRVGAAIDLVLDRARLNRSQFVFTRMRGREAIFWQTPASTRAARPGARVPRRRPEGLGRSPLSVLVDTRERYPWKFAGRPVEISREALPVGDYAVVDDRYELVGVVERKNLDDLAGCINDGSLSYTLAELGSTTRCAAVVVEGRYADLLKHPHAPGAFLADQLARMQVRAANVPIVFCDSRKHAEEYAWRLLAAAAIEHGLRADETG